MSRRPMCAAAPSPVSQSPPPQSQEELTSPGSCESSFLDAVEVAVGVVDELVHQLRGDGGFLR